MKEDILEQLVDDYLQFKGYFTKHNIKFRPDASHKHFVSKQDSNHSDIDVIGINPRLHGIHRVCAVSCKSWQAGFDVRAKLDEITENKIRSGRESWRFFRELVQPKWSAAFIDAVERETGKREFLYVTAVTRIKGDASLWENHPPFVKAMEGNPVKLLSLVEMLEEFSEGMGTTVMSSQFGRTIQLIRASGASMEWGKAVPLKGRHVPA